MVNGKSAIDWVIERYQKTMDKDSLIENNPNDYAGGKYVGTPFKGHQTF
ncbi:hypothetical protein HpMMM27_12240 [Helicobacter pylori]